MIGMKAILNLSKPTSFCGVIKRLVIPYANLLVVLIDIRNVFGYLLNIPNACYACAIGAVSPLVAAVLSLRNITQIAPSVIGTAVINVINFTFRLFARHHHEDNAMSFEELPVNGNGNVAASPDTTRQLASKLAVENTASRLSGVFRAFNRVKCVWCSWLPSKLTSVGIVGKNCTQKVCGWYFMLSHFVLLNRANRLVDEGVGAPLSAHFNTKKVSYGH